MRRLAIVALCLGLVACTANQVVTSAEVTVTAVEALSPFIASDAGIPAADEAQILTFTKAASTCLSQATALGASGYTAAIDAQIVATCAGVVSPVLSSGTPQNVAALVNVAASLVATFIAQFETVSPVPGGASAFAAAKKAVVAKLNAKQKARLAAVKARADAMAAKAKR